MKDTIQIVAMYKEHIGALCQLEMECFVQPWSRQSLENQLNNPVSHFFVALVSGEVAGYVGLSQVMDEAFFHNIAVFGRFRRRGVAHTLMHKVDTFANEKKLCRISLEVRASNRPAIRLYEKFGFVPAGKRKGLYTQPDEDAVVYTKTYKGDN